MVELLFEHGVATEVTTEVPRNVGSGLRSRRYTAVSDRASTKQPMATQTNRRPLWHLRETLGGTSVVNLSRIAVLLLLTLPLHSQSLDSLRNLLRENNPQLEALAYAYRAESTIGRQEAQPMDLQVSGGVSPMPVETRLGPQLARVGLLQMFPWPGTLAAMSDLADARAQPVLEEAAAMQLELLYELEMTYYEIVEAEATIATLGTSLALYASLREIALSRVENSRGSSVDVYRSELEANAAERRIRALRAMQEVAWTRIEQLVNAPLPRRLVLPATPGFPELPTDGLYADHPLVRIYTRREEIARRSLAVNDLDLRPEFGVGVDYVVTGRRTDADPEGNGQDMIMPHFMLRFPISKGRFNARREEEEIRLQEIDARRQATVLELTAALEAAAIRYADARDQLAFLDRQIELTEATLEIARTEYANSRRPFDELLRLQNELVDYRMQAVEAQTIILNQVATADRYLPRR